MSQEHDDAIHETFAKVQDALTEIMNLQREQIVAFAALTEILEAKRIVTPAELKQSMSALATRYALLAESVPLEEAEATPSRVDRPTLRVVRSDDD